MIGKRVPASGRTATAAAPSLRMISGTKIASAAVYGLLVALLVMLHASVTNSDFWVRIASGRLVVEERIIPRHDPFTFTVRGREWLDHEWLLGAVMFALNDVSYELLVVVASITAVLPFLMMHMLATKDRDDDWVLLAFIAFAALVAWRTYGIRPQLANPVFFVALIWLIDDRRRNASNSVWLSIPLMIIWANLQAGFLAGLAVMTAWLAICVIERRDVAISILILCGSAVAALLNAYGPELYSYTLGASFGNNTDRELVPEWQSPDFHDYLNIPALAGLLALAWFGVHRGSDRFRQVLMLGTLAASLISARFVPFFALSMIYAVAPHLPHVNLHWLAKRAMQCAAIGIAPFVIAGVISTANRAPPSNQVPVEGLRYLEENAPGTRVYADQSWGSFMTWSGWPTFFDTRTHQVFPEELISDYRKVERTRGDWLSVLDRWGIEYVMMPPESDLAEALDALRWERVFEGDIEVIWKRP